MKKAAAMKTDGVLAYSDEPLASTHFSHHAASCVFDATQTRVQQGHFITEAAWFDNEWRFSNRLLETVEAMMTSKTK